MYEDTKFKNNINWKSLIIKLSILALVVFLICFIAFRPKKDNIISLANNISNMKEAAISYYKSNLTAKEIGDYQKVTLKELNNTNLLEEQKDSKNNICDDEESYAYLTKTRDNEFVLKINMNCGKTIESKVFNLTKKDLTVIAANEEENEEIKNEEILVEEDIDEPGINEEIIKDDNELATDEKNDNKENTKPQAKPNKKPNNNIIADNENKVLRFKHIKYGEWIEGSKYADNVENSTKEIYYYNYCLNDYCVLDRIENLEKYEGYTATYNHSETVPVYRYIFVVWSNSCCIKGFINTGITELR